MRKVTLIISLFYFSEVNSQIIRANAYYRPFASGLTGYILTDYPGATAAYGLRKLKSDYSGSSIRVRRSSDNTEQDIGFSGDVVDTTAIKNFCGSSNGLVTTWYDQTGNGHDMTESTAGNQPRICNAGVIERSSGKPAVYFTSSSNQRLRRTATFGTPSASSVFAVFNQTGSGDGSQRVFSVTTAGTNDFTGTGHYIPILWNNSTTVYGTYADGAWRGTYTTSSSALNIVSNIHTGSQIRNTLNGGSVQTYNHTLNRTIGIISMSCNANDVNDANLLGYIAELIWYTSNEDANATAIRNAMNTYYSIY